MHFFLSAVFYYYNCRWWLLFKYLVDETDYKMMTKGLSRLIIHLTKSWGDLSSSLKIYFFSQGAYQNVKTLSDSLTKSYKSFIVESGQLVVESIFLDFIQVPQA